MSASLRTRCRRSSNSSTKRWACVCASLIVTHERQSQLKNKTPKDVKASLFRDSNIPIKAKKKKRTLVDALWKVKPPADFLALTAVHERKQSQSSLEHKSPSANGAPSPAAVRKASSAGGQSLHGRLVNTWAQSAFERECTRCAQVVLTVLGHTATAQSERAGEAQGLTNLMQLKKAERIRHDVSFTVQSSLSSLQVRS